MKIHPTALIDPSARLGENVRVGPYSVVGAGVEIGEHSALHAHVVVHSGVKIGQRNTLHAGAVLGDVPQDLGFDSATRSCVEIGDGNTFRENVTIHRASLADAATRVGDDCFLMAGAHLGHDVQLGNRVILANNVLLAGHVVIADRVFIGGGAVVHQHTRIGRLAILQGISGFSKDVPPFTIGAGVNTVAGLNVVGLKRSGLDREARASIQAAFALLYRSGHNVSQALAAAAEQLWSAEAMEFFDFVRSAKKRGICALIQSKDED